MSPLVGVWEADGAGKNGCDVLVVWPSAVLDSYTRTGGSLSLHDTLPALDGLPYGQSGTLVLRDPDSGEGTLQVCYQINEPLLTLYESDEDPWIDGFKLKRTRFQAVWKSGPDKPVEVGLNGLPQKREFSPLPHPRPTRHN